jgi:UDP-glucose:(heptosyl)LPS alpha-1,3-glucosyltransferase
MKIALSFPGCHRRGGVERVVYECARFLGPRGHDVHVVANEWQADAADVATCHRVYSLQHPWFLRGPSYFKQASKIVQSIDADVLATHGVICPFGGVHWVQSVQRAWLERCKEMRGPFTLARWRQRLNPFHAFILRLEEQHFGERKYRKLIVTTPVVREDLVRLYNVPREDISIIPNGFNPHEFSPDVRASRRQVEREKLGLKPDDIAMLLVANELDRKGYHTILSAMKMLGRSDLRLIVIGKPPKETVMRIASQFGVADRVLALGSSSDVAGFHAAADLFVLPTQYEAFSLAILESLGSGLPVLTSRVPGAHDAILPGVNGAVVNDPRDGEELARVLTPLLSHDVLSAYSARTPQTVVKYQWPNVLGRYEEMLADSAGTVPAREDAHANATAH